MIIKDIKKQVYRLAKVCGTRELKRKRPDLHAGHDLRYKKHWLDMLDQLMMARFYVENEPTPLLDSVIGDVTVEQFEANIQQNQDRRAEEDQELEKRRQQFYDTLRLSGMSMDKIDIKWARIRLNAKEATEVYTSEIES